LAKNDADLVGADPEFSKAQQLDSTLSTFWTKARDGSNEYKIVSCLLYRRTPNNILTEHEYLLMIPQDYRNQVLRMAHDTKMSWNLGARKTYKRIRTQFHFPRLLKAVKHYVKTCHNCQMTAPQKVNERVPLERMEVISDLPFQSLTLDILSGELPTTKRGNKYFLTIVCDATKWVHAIPLRSLKAENIATKLIEFFCIFGLPRTVRCDNMQGFNAELLTAVRQKLQIGANFSVPWHFVSHGSVERMNSTLESMLRKFIHEHKDWDSLIHYLFFFALRDVLHSGSKYSVDNHVVFWIMRVMPGRVDRGDTDSGKVKMSTVKYVENLTTNIETALKAARENMDKSQKKMKANFDKKSSDCELKIGEKAIVLLPTTKKQAFCEMRGPYTVIGREARDDHNNYQLQMGRRTVKMHINSLRRYNDRDAHHQTDSAEMVHTMIIEDSDGEIMTPGGDAASETDGSAAWRSVQPGEQLTHEQRSALMDLLSQYTDVLTNKPGRTTLIEHEIRLTDNVPVYQPSY